MIIIAGLTREDKRQVIKRVPILGYIPLIGLLFRNTADSVEKTNLLIFVTPRVVGDRVASEKVLQDWQKRTGLTPRDNP
jgi:type II secretory pathway component GspD/PulD (secretin)